MASSCSRPISLPVFGFLAFAAVSLHAQDTLPKYRAALEQLGGSEEYRAAVIRAADLYASNDYRATIVEARQAARLNASDWTARALVAMSYYQLGEAVDIRAPGGAALRERLCDSIVEAAEEGIRAAPERGECSFLRGLARARKATTAGVMYAIFRARSIENDWLRAEQCHSDFVTPQNEDLTAACYVALGIFYRLVPSSRVVKLLIGTRGDIDRSIDYLTRAVARAPDRIEYRKELGVSLVTKGIRTSNAGLVEQGREQLRLVPTLPIMLPVTDTIVIRHARMLLDSVELCPGYSRDQQQELDEAKLRK